MKSLKLAMAIVLLVLFIGVSFANVQAVAVSNEVCWEYDDGETLGKLKFVVLDIGGGNFLWSGISECPTGNFPAFGNAVVINGQIKLIYTQAGKNADDSLWTNIGNCTLIPPDLGGECVVRQVIDGAGEPVTKTIMLTPVPCTEPQ